MAFGVVLHGNKTFVAQKVVTLYLGETLSLKQDENRLLITAARLSSVIDSLQHLSLPGAYNECNKLITSFQFFYFLFRNLMFSLRSVNEYTVLRQGGQKQVRFFLFEYKNMSVLQKCTRNLSTHCVFPQVILHRLTS